MATTGRRRRGFGDVQTDLELLAGDATRAVTSGVAQAVQSEAKPIATYAVKTALQPYVPLLWIAGAAGAFFLFKAMGKRR